MPAERRLIMVDFEYVQNALVSQPQPGYDLPRRGDFLAALSTAKGKREGRINSTYHILGVRQVRRRDPKACPRFALHVRRAALPENLPIWKIWTFTWYPRQKKRLTFEEHIRRQQKRIHAS